MRSCRRRSVLAAAGCAAVLSSLTGPTAAHAASTDVNNDYGQSPAQVKAEVTVQVAATPAGRAARAKLATAHALAVKAATKDAKAKKAAAKSKTAAAKKAAKAAHVAAVKGKAAETKAVAALAKVTAGITALHYTPVDGTYAGAVAQYFIPGVGLEPMQVGVTVYAGHVSDVTVLQAVTTGESGPYNVMALPTLKAEAMAADGSAAVAAVSGATISSGAFQKSLQAALSQAGFKK